MYGVARHGRIALTALRSIPSSCAYASRTRFLVSGPRNTLSKSSGVTFFSSTSRYLQNHAVAEDFGAEDISAANREFTQFQELADAGIIDPKVVDTLTNQMNIRTMTEVQRMTINECLDGSDVVAQARTGTGKTLAFLMPIVQRMLRDREFGNSRPSIGDTRALIISPTRELAEQIGEEAKKIVRGTRVQVQMAVGGTQKQYHLKLMQRMGCHILVGTPGRVKDLLSDTYSGLKLDQIQTFVLDEADRLLDVGFADDIREIQTFMPSRSERDRQTLMFSATMPRSVVSLVRETMKPDFKFVRTVDPEDAATHESVPQHVVFLPGLQNQIPAITEIAMNAIEAHKQDPENNAPFKAIVFFRSLNEVRMAHETLRNFKDPRAKGGFFGPHPLDPCKIIEMSSKLEQSQRTANSQAFRRAESAIMISSDVSARGMDFPNVSHVIQVGMPQKTEDYIHRLGRTGRAGKPGQGWLLLQDDERNDYRQLVNSIHAHNIHEDRSLEAGNLDMTQPSQLSPQTAKIMQMVESGVKSVGFVTKAQTYQSLVSSLKMLANSSPQEIVRQVNELASFGWGLERPPKVLRAWAQKVGMSGVQGLEMMEGDRAGPRSGFQGRDSLDEREPFGRGMSRGRDAFGERRSFNDSGENRRGGFRGGRGFR